MAALRLWREGFLDAELAALGDERALLGGGEGEGGAGAGWEFGEDVGVGGAEFRLPLGVAEDLPVLGGDPVGAGEVGCWVEAFEFEEVGEAGRAGGVGDDGAALADGVFVEAEDGEHFAADGFVADPEDEAGTPLEGFGDVREGEEEGAEAVGVHGGSIRCGLRGRGYRFPPIAQCAMDGARELVWGVRHTAKLAEAEADGAFGGGGVDDVALLGDDDFSLGDEAAGGGSGGFHEGLPGAGGLFVGAALGSSADEACGFGGADGFVAATGGGAFAEEVEDGGFEGVVEFAGLVASAGVGAELDDVPVALPGFSPGDGAATGFADFLFVRGGAVGFGLAVGHGADWCG